MSLKLLSMVGISKVALAGVIRLIVVPNRFFLAALISVLVSTASLTQAQSPPPLPPLPGGFGITPAGSAGQNAQSMDDSDGPPAPGGGGGDGGTNSFPLPAFMTNSGLCLLPPVFISSNVMTLTVTNADLGAAYDVYMITNLNQTNWTWLGRLQPGQTNCTVTINCGAESYFQLGTMYSSNGDWLPDAYERLVGNSSSDGIVPAGWFLMNGFNPLTTNMGGWDNDLDGLSNEQEYLYGSDPNVSEGNSIWTSLASVCGLP